MKKKKLKKYSFEFLSIFVALVSAFALNNWNDNRKDSLAESKILLEILNGLEKDKVDIEGNIIGHKTGIKACDFWKKIFNEETPNLDTLNRNYFILTRDFISVQNSSGYQTLKSRGFELIKNDSLRTAIISLYEYDYQIIRKLEEEYNEHQFQANYFKEINDIIAPNFDFDTNGDIVGMKLPIILSEPDRKILLSILWKIRFNRRTILTSYNQTRDNIIELIEKIELELEDNDG